MAGCQSATPRAVLFDLDGTLVDSMPSIANALVETLATFGYRVTTEALIPTFGPSMPEIISTVTGVDAERAKDIYAAYLLVYYEQYMTQAPPLAGAEALLQRLAGDAVRLAIVTSKIERGARAMLEHLGWSDRFGVVVGSDTAGIHKPSPKPALHALHALDVSPGDAAFVGDTAEDMRCAVAAGIPLAVGVQGAHGTDLLRSGGAAHVCDDLDGVASVLLPGTVSSSR